MEKRQRRDEVELKDNELSKQRTEKEELQKRLDEITEKTNKELQQKATTLEDIEKRLKECNNELSKQRSENEALQKRLNESLESNKDTKQMLLNWQFNLMVGERIDVRRTLEQAFAMQTK